MLYIINIQVFNCLQHALYVSIYVTHTPGPLSLSLSLAKHLYHLILRLYTPFKPFSIPPFSIEGEYVPVEGDEVSYKVCSIPPKHEKIQAVEVTITHLKPGTKHETWAGHVISS